MITLDEIKLRFEELHKLIDKEEINLNFGYSNDNIESLMNEILELEEQLKEHYPEEEFVKYLNLYYSDNPKEWK